MTGSDPDGDIGDDTAAATEVRASGLRRTVLTAIGLALAAHPLHSIAEAIAVTTGRGAATTGFWVVVAVWAVLIGYGTDWPLDSVGLFAAVTLFCWVGFSWTLGIHSRRLEYAPAASLDAFLVFLAAAAIGVAVGFGDELAGRRTDAERREAPADSETAK